MKKLLFVFILLFALFISNPSKAEYVDWANKQIVGTNGNLLSKVGNAIIPPIISEATNSANYLCFTIYKSTNIDGSVYTTLGILRNFILVSKTEGHIHIGNSNNDINKNSLGDSNVNIEAFIEDAGNKVNDFINGASKAINDIIESNKIQSTTENINELDVGGAITEGSVYNNYTNGRYGFSIDYPNQFSIGVTPQNGDGLEFISSDGKSNLVAFGSNNVMDENAKDLYEAELANIKDISYKFFKDNWFVISWTDNGTVYYTRTIVGTGSINSFIFSCPEEQLDQYYDIIEHISKSFRKGNIEIAN